MSLFSFLDASHAGSTPFCPAVENMTVALTHPNLTKPIFRSLCVLAQNCSRGKASPLSHQSRQNIIIVQGLKRGGYRVPGSHEVGICLMFEISGKFLLVKNKYNLISS